MHQPIRLIAERDLHLRLGHRHPVTDVVGHLALLERRDVIPHRDALVELLQLRQRQRPPQFGLTHQHDLNQLGRLGLQIADHPDLLKRVGAQVLRLVDNQHDVVPVREFGNQKLVEPIQQRLLRVGFRRQPVTLVDRLEQFQVGQIRVEHHADAHALLVELAKHRAAQRRLAAADLAGQADETLALLHAEQQRGQRFLMPMAEEKKLGVGRQIERGFAETEELQVHGAPSWLEGGAGARPLAGCAHDPEGQPGSSREFTLSIESADLDGFPSPSGPIV
ncbi:MAG: hypothetical protein BWZ08_01205 [candidate division BRC1 bacterium ADurb.BinA292]|nr:MAG: hypothetical protein BWZ08_01205 [candidate division BRC1 bacterium ADurb.BinA292]